MASRSPDPASFLARYWFPLALVALLLLGIPGVVLFALNLLGREGLVNRWLEDRFQLSYHLPVPWWFALGLLLVPVAIVLLYFLKLKRKPLSVPSTFLWRKSIEDLHVNSLFQWLRQNVLLLLQILAVLFLIYALLGLRFHGRGGTGKHYILLIDNSASMSATDVAPSRLEWAKQEARKEIDAASDHDVGMVIVFNSKAQTVQSYTRDRNLLRRAVDEIRPTQRPTRIEEALALADSLANPSRSTEDVASRPADAEPGKERTYVPTEGIPTEVHLFSDGRFPDVPEFAVGNLSLHYHAAGQPGLEHADNVALVSLNALRDERDLTKLLVFAAAKNYRNRPVRTEAQLEVRVDGRLQKILQKTLELPARKVAKEPGQDDAAPRDTPGAGAATFELTDVDDRAHVTLHARLLNAGDRFPLDDEAWLVAGVVRKARVLIVGNANEVLHAFFDDDSIRAVATIQRLTPDRLASEAYRRPAGDGAYDLVVFDRCGPDREEDLPRANTFFIGHPPPPWTWATVAKVKHPPLIGWMDKHPLLRYLAALQDVGVGEAFTLSDEPGRTPRLPPRTPRLIETAGKAALLLTLSRESFTDLVLTFPLIDNEGRYATNWPLKPSFPLFLRNVLYTLGNISDGAAEETVQPGQVKTLRPDAAVNRIEVTDPEGQVHALERGSRAEFSFGATDRVGVYRVTWDGQVRRRFAVNLLDADESHIEPRPAVQIGAERVAAGQQRRQPRELWKAIVLAALGLLLLEWYIYNRRVYV
jgi:hypothetical protein